VGIVRAAKTYRVWGLYLLIGALPLRGDCLTLRAIFDVLFPSTPFKKLLTNAMQLHGVLDTFEKNKGDKDVRLLHQMIGGRLAQLEGMIDDITHERVVMRAQDVEYLLTVLDKTVIRVRQVICVHHAQDEPIHPERIIRLQEKIERLL
jgi:hypothetical protein